MTIYYVYAYLREDGSPYYIGKGSGNRAWCKGRGEIGKPTDRSRIIIVENNLTEVGALAIERRLIRWYGRIDLGDGTLRNKTEGGDNPPTFVSHSYETRKKISESRKGIVFSPAHMENLRKAKRYISDETRAKMSAAKKGKKRCSKKAA